ncbi:MAG: hypothetical protein RR393_05560 [Bacteroidales bacterium]
MKELETLPSEEILTFASKLEENEKKSESNISNKRKSNQLILKNKRGYNILIVNNQSLISSVYDLDFSKMDAIYFHISSPLMVKKITTMIRSSLTDLNYLVPVFSSNLIGKIPENEDLLDGYTDSLENELISDKIEFIKGRMKSFINFDIPLYRRPLSIIALQILRYYYVRGNSIPVYPDAYSIAGYVIPFTQIYLHSKEMATLDAEEFINKLIEAGRLKATFKDKVHLCPDCTHVQLNFREICPKCGSTDIYSHPMVHHFSCAYIGAESEFVQKNQLICPKCNNVLRHIGIDYDKPANAYHCQNCQSSFWEPKMTAFCFFCGRISELSELKEVTISDLEFTEEGIPYITDGLGLAKEDAMVPIIPGFVSYQQFCNDLSRYIYHIKNIEEDYLLSVLCIVIKLQEKTADFASQRIYELYKEIGNELLLHMDINSIPLFYNNMVYVTFNNRHESEVNTEINNLKTCLSECLQGKYKDRIIQFSSRQFHYRKSMTDSQFFHLLSLE